MQEVIVEKATPEKLKELNIETWAPWSCDESIFDWTYIQDERAYIMEGEVTVTKKDSDESVTLKAGDIVLFKKGFACTWKVTKPIKKVYRFE